MKEGAPSTPEDSSDSSTTTSKKRRGLGHLAAVSPERRAREERAAAERAEKAAVTRPEPRRSLFEKAEPAPEQVAPLEKVSTEAEQPTIVQALAGERGEAVAGEVTDGSPEAEAAKAAAAEFYAEAERTGDPEAAYEAAREVAGAPAEASPEAADEDGGEAEPGTEAPEEIEDSDTAETGSETDEWEEAVVFDRTAEAADETPAAETAPDETEEEDEVTAAAGGAGVAGGGSGAGTASSGGSGGAGGDSPPPGGGPGRPAGLGGPGRPYGPAYYGAPGGPPLFGGGFNPGLVPSPSRPNVAPPSPDYDVGNPAVTALIGGIVGYLIGRRRGRIKTEKRLLPIQKKLEKQVVNLDWQLQEKEAKIRRQAVEQVRLKGATEAERIRQTAAERRQRRQRERERITTLRQPAPEAHHLHGSKRQEHLGQMLLAAEAPLLMRQSQTSEMSGAVRQIDKKLEVSSKLKPEPEAVRIGNQRIETLNRAELLNIGEKIVVGGSTLRQIYESHLVGERGLRRLVSEHLRGGDLKKALRQEIVEREIDFERDPAMRDLGGGTADSAVNGSGKAALDNLVQKATAGLPTDNEEAAFYKARARYEAIEHEQEQKQQHIIDISLTVVIVSLLAAVVYLFITRG